MVDKFNDRFISAFVTATHMRLVLLHDGKSEETVRSFFHEVPPALPHMGAHTGPHCRTQ